LRAGLQANVGGHVMLTINRAGHGENNLVV
jgi:hypothetical protein